MALGFLSNFNETFNTKLKVPNKDLVYLYDEGSLFDKTEHSNFSNMSEFYKNLFNNVDEIDIKELPKPLYRDNDNLTVLNKLKSKIAKDKNYILLDTKSWIQTIPDNESSNFLSLLTICVTLIICVPSLVEEELKPVIPPMLEF